MTLKVAKTGAVMRHEPERGEPDIESETRAFASRDDSTDESGGASAGTPRRVRLRELGVAIGVIAVGGLVLTFANLTVPASGGDIFGPRWWPTVLSFALMVVGAALVVVALIKPDTAREDVPTVRGAVRLLLVLALVALYGIAWYFVHFLVVTPLLVCALTFVLGARGWRDLIILPIVVTVVLYGVFGLLLGVPL